MSTTVPVGSAGRATSSVLIITASLSTGSVMWTMTVATTRMSPCPNAVSSAGGTCGSTDGKAGGPVWIAR